MNQYKNYLMGVLASLFISLPSVARAEEPGEPAEEVRDNQACLECHTDADTVGKKYVVTADRFTQEPHVEDNDVTCVSCHTAAAKVEDISDHGKLGPASCASCHETDELKASMHGERAGEKRPTCASCHGHGHKVVPVDHKDSLINRAEVNKNCDTCHKEAHAGRRDCIHFELLKKGDPRGATCVDCHGGHAIQMADVKQNPQFRVESNDRCGACHKTELEHYSKSIHGEKFIKEKDLNSASCLDCHYDCDLGVMSHLQKRSMTHKSRVSATCAACHEDARVVKREGLNPAVVNTYKESFHGRAMALGSSESATCSSCHKYHDVYRVEDPRSSVHPNNIKESCGSCHPGANENFLTGKIHVKSGAREKKNHWAWMVRTFYIWLIVLVIGGMLLHNLLDFIRKMIIRARRQASEPHVIRMTRLERITHFLFLSSFISLAYTGFVLMYPEGWFVQPLHLLGVTEAGRANLHRGAAVVMTLLVLHHIYFILFTKLGREQGRHFLPRFQDLVDVYHNILFFIGRREERPRFDRFGYAEKAEYLALVWGTAVMVITGFILWFEQYSLAFMPLWLYEVFGIVHRLEAVLAVLSIIVWHFYYVFINPDESPMALTWLTGRMTHHELKETHPIDYERQVKDKEEQ